MLPLQAKGSHKIVAEAPIGGAPWPANVRLGPDEWNLVGAAYIANAEIIRV
jgi:hypothetical protein